MVHEKSIENAWKESEDAFEELAGKSGLPEWITIKRQEPGRFTITAELNSFENGDLTINYTLPIVHLTQLAMERDPESETPLRMIEIRSG